MMKLLQSNKSNYFLYVLIVIGLLLKVLLLDYQYIDYGFYLSHWIQEIKDNGYLLALKEPFYNYTPTYMYILVLIAKLDVNSLYAIKLVSILFEYILAYFVGRLLFLRWRLELVKLIPFAVIPLLPTVLLNSAFMSQCDSIYTTFIIGSIYFLFTKKQCWGMLFLGIAFALKAQTAIILPFYFVYMLRGHIKWYLFLIVPLVYVISILPVWFAGRSFVDLLTIYIAQAEYNAELVKNFPNIYIWIAELGDLAKLVGMTVILLFTLLGGWWMSKKKYVFTLEQWYKLILLSAIVCPFFLPGMLERYMYLGDIFAVVYMMLHRRNIFIGISLIFISFYSYIRCIYVFSFSEHALYPATPFSIFEDVPWEIVSCLYVIMIAYVAYDFIISFKISKDQVEFVAE